MTTQTFESVLVRHLVDENEKTMLVKHAGTGWWYKWGNEGVGWIQASTDEYDWFPAHVISGTTDVMCSTRVRQPCINSSGFVVLSSGKTLNILHLDYDNSVELVSFEDAGAYKTGATVYIAQGFKPAPGADADAFHALDRSDKSFFSELRLHFVTNTIGDTDDN